MKTMAECGRDRFSFEERRVAVQKCREISGLTQAELAHLAKVSQPKVSQFENGDQDLGEEAFLASRGGSGRGNGHAESRGGDSRAIAAVGVKDDFVKEVPLGGRCTPCCKTKILRRPSLGQN